jgi:hypothetical protein
MSKNLDMIFSVPHGSQTAGHPLCRRSLVTDGHGSQEDQGHHEEHQRDGQDHDARAARLNRSGDVSGGENFPIRSLLDPTATIVDPTSGWNALAVHPD